MPSAFADSMQDITKNIRSVCAAPDQKGKYWNVDASGDTKIKIKFLGTKAGLSSEISSGEWEGIQRVLKEQQADEHKNYRDCVKSLTPIFLKNFTEKTIEKKPILVKGNDFSLDLSGYEEGDIAYELGEELVVLNKNNKKVISGLKENLKGKIKIGNLKLKNKFRIEISSLLILKGEMEFILRTRDDDIDNDIKIKIKGGYFTFGETQKSGSEVGYKSNGIDDFVIYMKKNVVKFYVNDKYFSSMKANNTVTYDKLIIKGIKPVDSIYDISGYNINN